MYPFIETIRIEDGQIYNLDYHTERFNKTRAAFWKDSTPLDLREFISPPTLNGIHKCRIVYGKEVEEVIVAYDALAVVVHPSNPVKQLTRQQLEDIFRGKITNWKQVGGDDRKIVVYSRETSSGTYEFFKESVLKNKNYMSSSLSMPATGAIIQSVSQTKGAIGYVGLAYLSPRVKSLSISYDGTHFAPPTMESATDKSYPIVRPLYYYYNTENSEQATPLIHFILSPAGQEIIKKSGYIPVK